MTPQTISQLVLLLGLLLSAVGGFCSYYFGKVESAKNQKSSTEAQAALNEEITKLRADFNAKTDLIYDAVKVKQDVWTALEIQSVPPGVTDYLLLLFKSDKGRISGKVRVKGSENVAYFSTTVNDTKAVVVPNVWLPTEQHYQITTIIEFLVTEKTADDASLSILTQGWIDTRGREPH